MKGVISVGISRLRSILGYLSLGRVFCGLWVGAFIIIGTIGFFGHSPWYVDVAVGLIIFLGIMRPMPWIFYLQLPAAVYGACALGHFLHHLAYMITIFAFWFICFVIALINSRQLGKYLIR